MIEKDGWLAYQVPVGSALYRGDTELYQTKYLGDTIIYLSKTVDTAKIYGCVAKFHTSQPLVLLAMDKLSNIEKLLRDSPVPSGQALLSTFPIRLNRGPEPEPKLYRNSDAKKDKIIAAYICGLGFDGYAADRIEQEEIEGKYFHEEIMICNRALISELFEFLRHTECEIDNYLLKHSEVRRKAGAVKRKAADRTNEMPRPLKLNF